MLTIEQKEQRRTGIGGSDVAALFNTRELETTKWKTALDIYFEKIGEETEEDTTTQKYQTRQRYFEMGNKAEPFLRSLYEKKTGNKVEHTNSMIRSEKNPFMIANLDGYVKSENVIVEFKKVNRFMEKYWGEEGSDHIPLPYHFQSSHYSCVGKDLMNVKRVDIVASFMDLTSEDILLNFDDPKIIEYVLNRDLRIFHYYPHEQLEKGLIEKESDFWFNHVMAKVPPPPSSIEDALRMYPIEEKKVLIANSEQEKKIKEFDITKETIKTYEDQEKELKEEILKMIEGASVVMNEEGENLLYCSHRKLLNKNRFIQENPEIYNDFLVENINTEKLKKERPDLYRKYVEKSATPTLRVA